MTGEAAPIRDEPASLPVRASRTVHAGRVFDLMTESVDLGEAGVVERDVVRHPGAVAVLALDDQGRVALVQQYRHPVRHYLWEVPAGLLDVPAEPLLVAAQRELAEEADLRAGSWHTLVDFLTSPGASDEAVRVFLARDLGDVPEGERFERTEEEAGMRVRWVPLADAVGLVLGGAIHNPSAVVGILAAHTAALGKWRDLRAADAPWITR